MVLCERLMLSDEYVSVSGEAGVLNEEVDLCKVGRDGNIMTERGVWESTDLSLEEMRVPLTELSPPALSNSILSFTEQDRAEDQKGCERSHMLLANSPSLMIWKGGLG